MLIKMGFCFLVLLSWVGCTPKEGTMQEPKDVLSSYITQSFAVASIADKAKMAEYLGGDAKIRLLAWSDEQFKSAFIDTKKKFVKLVILESKSINASKVALTYELSFVDESKGKEAKVTLKKMSELEKNDQGKWIIVNVQSLKEVIEFKDELSLP